MLCQAIDDKIRVSHLITDRNGKHMTDSIILSIEEAEDLLDGMLLEAVVAARRVSVQRLLEGSEP